MISVLRMHSRCMLLLLHAPRINYAVGGSALDWVRADIRVHYGAAFAAAVAGMRANTACAAEPRRYAAGHSRTEYTAFGSKLIVPPWARRVAEEHSPLLHFQAAAQLGWVGDRLQDIELPSDQKCAIEHTLYASAAARRLRSKVWFDSVNLYVRTGKRYRLRTPPPTPRLLLLTPTPPAWAPPSTPSTTVTRHLSSSQSRGSQ